MAIAALFNYIAPSNRGLLRTKGGSRHHVEQDLQDDGSSRIERTGRRRKRFRAMSVLTSFASDIDVLSDWLFYHHTVTNDAQYRADYKKDSSIGNEPYLIPPLLLRTVLIVSLAGTVLWLILATDGQVLMPLLKRCGIDNLSMGFVLFLVVLFEDIPQVILTFLVQDYYEEEKYLSNFAVCNLMASLYDTLIKLAEAYDERDDVVETGIWCKQSIVAHKNSIVTGVQALPVDPEDLKMSKRLSNRDRRRSILDEALLPHAVQPPRLRFLTTSMDKTVCLWDSSGKENNTGYSARTFCGHLQGVTCVTLYFPKEDPLANGENATEFLTGCRNGVTKLWNLNGVCIRNFYCAPPCGGVADIAVLDAVFVCGYEKGIARLWDASTGLCVGEYRGHGNEITSVCSMLDNHTFATASVDESIRLWDSYPAVKSLQETGNLGELRLLNEAIFVEQISIMTFIGHSGPVLSVACIRRGSAFLSGSQDTSVRLWSISTGSCLRIFTGHSSAVSVVASIDQATILTGSHDETIKVWDIVSGNCLRTYSGHEDNVTDLSIAEDKTTFVSSSNDGTVKLWVLTTVAQEDPSAALDQILDLNETVCNKFDGVCGKLGP